MYSLIKSRVVTIGISVLSTMVLLMNSEAYARAGEFFSSGTAFAITKNGYLATNFHVIDGLDEIKAFDQNKKGYTAEVVAVDPSNDLAILSINHSTTPLFLENAARIRKGSEVSTLGFPNIDFQGYESKFTNGSITSESGLGGDVRFFQISTPIQPGNSGGPLLDSRGSVIGIVSAKLNDKITLIKGEVAQNVNYAVKVQYLLAMIASTRAVRDQLLQSASKTVKSREDVAELADSAVYLIYGKGKEAVKPAKTPAAAPAAPTAPPPVLNTPENARAGTVPAITLVNPQEVAKPGINMVRIGHVGPLTGPTGHLGRDDVNGARMAIQDLNALNLVIGGQLTKFELITEDDGGDPRQAVNAAQRLVDMGVKGVVGHMNSGPTISASKIYFEAGIPQISPAATSSSYTSQGYNTTFRVVANDAIMASRMAKVATKNLAAKRIAMIDDGSVYSTSMKYLFQHEAEQLGISIVSTLSVGSAARSFNAEIIAIKNSNPDTIFFSGMDSQAIPFIQQLYAQGVYAKIIGTFGMCTYEFARQTKGVIQDSQVFCALTGGFENNRAARLDAFKRRYKDRFGLDLQAYAPYAYDAVYTLSLAMKHADSVEPQRYLRFMKSIKANGVTGVISFDENGDVLQPAITFYTFKNGQRVLYGVSR